MSNTTVTNVNSNSEEWQVEREAWNSRSEFFVELHEK